MSEDRFNLNFHAPDRLELTSMEGNVSRYNKLQTHAHSGEELKAFAGRYQSDEVGAVFEIALVNNLLKVRLNEAAGTGSEFTPIGGNTFQLAGVIMRFISHK